MNPTSMVIDRANTTASAASVTSGTVDAQPRTEATSASDSRSARRGEYDHYEPLFVQFKKLPPEDPNYADLRDRLIAAHLPVAEHVAQLYRNRGEPSQDLVQVARIGLINAVDRYRPEYGRGFLPFAVPTIRGEVQRHFRDATWGMRVPRRLKELQSTLSSATAELTERLGRAPRPSELADHLGLTTEQVHEGLHASAAYHPESLNRTVKQDDSSTERGELIGDDDAAFDTVEDAEFLRLAIRSLPERQRRIVALRFFREMTQSQIASAVGISQMHVSRLLTKSLAQLRAHLAEHGTTSVE